MQENAAAQVRFIGVSKHYGEHNVQALQNVTLDIPRGKFVALMGPSGCGKSTLLNCAGGIDVPDSGQIIIDGNDITKLDERELTLLRRDKIGFVFQFFNLLSTLTVSENIHLPLDLSGALSKREVDARTAELLAEVGLTERAHFYPSQLSGGEMQRVAVVRAIIHRPQIIIADEPTGNLDTNNGVTVLNMLKELCVKRGETVVMATHSPEAAQFADIVVHMKDGSVMHEAGENPAGRTAQA
jgi:putative ABC transport system ATP-binding protein